MNEQEIRVFVVEDEFYTLNALRVFLSQDPRTVYVGGAQNPEQALEKLQSSSRYARPDVVLLDMRFRDVEGKETLEGLELLRKIKSGVRLHGSQVKVLCISMKLDPTIVVSALSSGADGYLDKNQVSESIVDAVEWVHQGKTVVSPNIADRIVGIVKGARNDIVLFPDKQVTGLSDRTEQVAFLYYRCGMTAGEIGRELHIAESTVRTHIKKIKSVLEETTRTEVIRKLTERGEID